MEPVPVDAFEYGRIVIDGRVQHRDVIFTRSTLHPNWWRDDGHRLTLDDLGVVLEEQPDVLVVGTGTSGRMRPEPGLEQTLAERGIRMEAMPTDEAVRRVNELLAKGTNAAAALHLTC
jgi:hypothetical protein